jgi:thiamine kinase-like enzyme
MEAEENQVEIIGLLKDLHSQDLSQVINANSNSIFDHFELWNKQALEKEDNPTEPLLGNSINREKIQELREFMGAQPLVLTHGDMHLGNLLYSPGDRKGLIDFEFSGYSYPALDVAMLIMSFQYDYNATAPGWV